jgi:acetyl esterase/lipase
MKLNYKIVKKFSNKEISIKENLKLYRNFQKILNPIHKKSKYEDIKISLTHRDIKVRVFNDFNDNQNHKIIIFLHGGGWVSGSIDSYTNFCHKLSKETNHIVLSIDYRLAPENPFPAGFEDCFDITYLVYKNIKTLNIKAKDICLMGDSAGGNLVAAIAHRARNERKFKVNKMILLYPTLQTDYSLKTPYKSVIHNGYDYLLTRKILKEYTMMYVSTEDDLYDPYCAPLYDRSFKKLPESLIITCNLDPLRDEGRHYVEKLRNAKNKVTHIEYDVIHAYMTNKIYKEEIKETYIAIKKFLGDENE